MKISRTLRTDQSARTLIILNNLQALLVEKVLASSGASPEDVAKTLLIQTALRAKGVPAEVIAAALNKIIKNTGDGADIIKAVETSLKNNDISIEEINKVLAMSKALDGGKIRGLKDLQKILEAANTSSIEGLEQTLREIFDSGALTPESLAQSVMFQKALKATGLEPSEAAKSILLQKSMVDSGMPAHEVAQAMSIALSIEGQSEETLRELKEALRECLGRGLTPEDVDIVAAFKEALEKGEIPKEAINLMKKAMKQRRGSVDNVCETLMSSLVASGESQDSIAKAMVKALQATGATPEEIAKTMQQAMSKMGASQEEICKAMAAAMVSLYLLNIVISNLPPVMSRQPREPQQRRLPQL